MNNTARDLNPISLAASSATPTISTRTLQLVPGATHALATREKGRAVVESIVANILKQIDDLSHPPLSINRLSVGTSAIYSTY